MYLNYILNCYFMQIIFIFKFLSIIILLNNNLKIWLLKKLELIKIMKIKITNY